MSGSTPTNSAAVDFERQQAADAAQKEAQRQARLQQGQTLIDQIFNGTPVTTSQTQSYDWSKFNPTAYARTLTGSGSGDYSAGGAPAGYSIVNVPGKSGSTGGGTETTFAPNPNYGQFGQQNPTIQIPGTSSGGAAGGSTWALKDASGKIYYLGDPFSYTSQTPTGQTTGGFNDDFYNSYRQKYLDYYDPQEQRQYDVAKRDLLYSLANAGTNTSSIAAGKFGELGYTDALAKAKIASDANTATGNLQSQILGNKEALINQLYATEDPTLTANLAQESAKASQLADPTTTPIAAFFAPAASAVGAAAGSYLSPYSLYGNNQQRQQGTVAPANSDSGKIIWR
jgi:hypothetical protein